MGLDTLAMETRSRGGSMGETPDLAQARRALAGDRAAFDGLFDRYADRVYRLAHRHAGEEEQARELAERMLDRVFHDLPGYRGQLPLDAWVLVKCKAVLATAARSKPQPGQAWEGCRLS
jgi:DNA-directed RNA polymerase specialized sigma24 family protein